MKLTENKIYKLQLYALKMIVKIKKHYALNVLKFMIKIIKLLNCSIFKNNQNNNNNLQIKKEINSFRI